VSGLTPAICECIGASGSVLQQCVAVCCSVLQRVIKVEIDSRHLQLSCSPWQCVAVWCTVWQCVAVCYSKSHEWRMFLAICSCFAV